jgi:uncharacterized protein YyaL (SSP411 family)
MRQIRDDDVVASNNSATESTSAIEYATESTFAIEYAVACCAMIASTYVRNGLLCHDCLAAVAADSGATC